jgi:predicted membrane protein
MSITGLSADTGGGNMDVILPENAANLSVTAKSGAGNVVVCIPSGVAARIHATTGLGKTSVDPRFSKIDKDTYQSSDFDHAVNKIEITVHSGAGNVSVNTQ